MKTLMRRQIWAIRYDIGEEKHVKLFFDLLGIEPDWEKINYYILLDELY
jgi:aminoglycoside 3'-phosphotransferase-3